MKLVIRERHSERCRSCSVRIPFTSQCHWWTKPKSSPVTERVSHCWCRKEEEHFCYAMRRARGGSDHHHEVCQEGHRCNTPGKTQIWTSSLPKAPGICQCFAEQSISRWFPGVIHWTQEFSKDSATLILKKLSGQKNESVIYHGFHKSPSSEWCIWDIAQKSLTVVWFISGQYVYAAQYILCVQVDAL